MTNSKKKTLLSFIIHMRLSIKLALCMLYYEFQQFCADFFIFYFFKYFFQQNYCLTRYFHFIKTILRYLYQYILN